MLYYFCFPRVTVSVCDIRVMAYRYFDFCQLLPLQITIPFRHLIKHTHREREKERESERFLSWPSNVYIILFLALKRSRHIYRRVFLPILQCHYTNTMGFCHCEFTNHYASRITNQSFRTDNDFSHADEIKNPHRKPVISIDKSVYGVIGLGCGNFWFSSVWDAHILQ